MASANPEDGRQPPRTQSRGRGGRPYQGRSNYRNISYEGGSSTGRNQLQRAEDRTDNVVNANDEGSQTASSHPYPKQHGRGPRRNPRNQGNIGRGSYSNSQQQGPRFYENSRMHQYQDANVYANESAAQLYSQQTPRQSHHQDQQSGNFYDGTPAHQWNRQYSQPPMEDAYSAPHLTSDVRSKSRGDRVSNQGYSNGYSRSQQLPSSVNSFQTSDGGFVSRNPPSSQYKNSARPQYETREQRGTNEQQHEDYSSLGSNGYSRSQQLPHSASSFQTSDGGFISRNPPISQYKNSTRPQYEAREQRGANEQQNFHEDYSSLIAARNKSRDYLSRPKTSSREPRGGGGRRQEPFRRTLTVEKVKVMPELADSATQRERLSEQLTKGVYECMVCCESVKQDHSVWNCGHCFHVFHLGCIRRWIRSSQDESGHWRCPGCQSTSSSAVNTYYCFCLKQKNPEWNRREIPHSCGEVCGKNLGDGQLCSHACTLLCHPGPCPSCAAQTTRKCPCGKTSQLVKCGSSDALLCGSPCNKMLECGLHACLQSCHTGACQPCDITVNQTCFCGQNSRKLACSVEHSPEEKFECAAVCMRLLECGKHQCLLSCHQGSCGPCPLQVDKVHSCPCGKTELALLYRQKKKPAVAERKNCTDPVPVCGQSCHKELTCGPTEKHHKCSVPCHEGSCPPCTSKTVRKCRCGRNEKTIPCVDLAAIGEVLCERRCNKKRQCGRHKCIQVCCIDKEHICMLVCGRQLSCGLHRCEALCHAGNCARCYRVSFDELACHCGSEITYPPVPCGARPPECNKPCSRPPRPCGHEAQHNCHPEATCPPCYALCEKQCYGQHEIRKNVPCHLTQVSCGKPCGKPLSCGRHTCILSCHDGACPTTCSQPCPVTRSECPHSCGIPCHIGVCPSTSCREKVRVQCQCGQRVATVSCEEQQTAFKKMATALLASKMTALQLGECVDFKDLLGPNVSSTKQAKSLECNEECALIERNRRLALALQIQNPNPKPGAPRYQDSLKEWAKKDPRFVQMVHDKLTDLVQLAKQSMGKMRSRSHSFDPMNRDKRQFIHDYCVFFGCETASYDEEPKRNVVATAFGETSFLPGVGVLEVTQREQGQRKMPGPPTMKGVTLTAISSTPAPQPAAATAPATSSAWGKKSSGNFRTLSEVVKSAPARPAPSSEATVTATATPGPKTTPPAVVDYFDFTS